jgi:hypothetical protein
MQSPEELAHKNIDAEIDKRSGCELSESLSFI